MTEPFIFSYIVVDERYNDLQGRPVVGIYPFSSNNAEDRPTHILRSAVPAVTANIYRGNPFPWFDYDEAIETRVKLDIAHNVEYAASVAIQMNGQEWHFEPQA